ncbi:uncharacterized protein SCHCODRAFT_02618142 [Schizophyllum commune H4-8]|nr:uncharacterized protein SCHCODRAFT_02618142 [Schizophyllum commune H4-8]KAI5894938.1 hypothetical protein SCHCODRAFT_02618142 [Schizophyllum commune H4-8]
MDMDWCLACNRHLEEDAEFGQYCSFECQAAACPAFYNSPPVIVDASPDASTSGDEDDEDMIFHYIESRAPRPPALFTREGLRDEDWINHWAATVDPGEPEAPPAAPYTPPPASLPSSSASSSRSSLAAPSPTAPHVLCQPYQRPIPPTLCMSNYNSTRSDPSLLDMSSSAHIAAISISSRACEPSASIGRPSFTDSSLATPGSSPVPVPVAPAPHKTSVLAAVASHVRSWIGEAGPLRRSQSREVSALRDAPVFPVGATVAPTVKTSRTASLTPPFDDENTAPWWPRKDGSWGKRPLVDPTRGLHATIQLPLRPQDPFNARGRRQTRVVA